MHPRLALRGQPANPDPMQAQPKEVPWTSPFLFWGSHSGP